MPRSTSSLRLDTEQAGLRGDNRDGRIPVEVKEVELEPHSSHLSSFRRPGEGSASRGALAMARKIACNYGGSKQLCPSVRGRDSYVVFLADIYR
jgi:hypothetical protein